MFEKLKRKREIKSVKAQLVSGAQQGAAIVHAAKSKATIIEQALNVAKGQTFTLTDAGLVETRRKKAANYGSMPINIGDVNFRVGRVQDASRDELTHIDTGKFVMEAKRCVFTGGTQTRVWEHAKIVGYDTSRADMLLIAVSNRERMSGILYEKQGDFAIEAYFMAWYEGQRDNVAAVSEWSKRIAAEANSELAERQVKLEGERAQQLAVRLAQLVGRDEAQAFLDTLPGVSVTIEGKH